MQRPIKFRGRDIDTGEIIYGDFRKIGIHAHIFKEADCYYEEELIEVDPDSVAQLVGFDSEGNEIYEGDTVAGVDEDWVAVLVPDILHSKEDIKDVPFKFLTLKEAES